MNFKINKEISKIYNKTELSEYIRWLESYKDYENTYDYALKVNEFFLKKLTNKLNFIHNLNYSKNDWRFLLGTWLFSFILDVFLKFKYLKKKKLIKINENYANSNSYVPQNCLDFSYKVYDESYHKNIFRQLSSLKFKKKIFFNSLNNLNPILLLLQKFYLIINFFFSKIIKSNVIFFTTYLGFFRNLFLYLSLKQFPYFFFQERYIIKKNKINYKLREFNLIKNRKSSLLHKILDKLISKNIPMSYLENFKYFHSNIFKYYANVKPKIIFSSNYDHFDYFKIYCLINKKKYKTKLVFGQHGGGFFAEKRHLYTSNSQKIFKYFITLGYKKNNNYLPIFFLKKNNIKPNFNGKALFTAYQFNILLTHRNTYTSLTTNIIFFNNLNKKISCNILFNPYTYNPFKKAYKLLKKKFDFNFVYKKNYFDSLIDCRINIITLNSTTILQSLNINFPTIIFFNLKDSNLNNYGKNSYNLLKKANIFFDNPKDAAKKINKIWDNVEQWWFEKERQRLVTEFCNRMCKRSENVNNELKKYFKKLI